MSLTGHLYLLRVLSQGLRKRTKKELLALHLSFLDQICIPVYEVIARHAAASVSKQTRPTCSVGGVV